MKKDRILIFSTSYKPFWAGAEVAIKEITDRVFDFDFDLITGKYQTDLSFFEKYENVNIYRVGVGSKHLDKILLPFLGAILILYLRSKYKYKIFWCMMASFGSGAAYIANIVCFLKPVPIVLSIQEGDSLNHIKKRWFGMIQISWILALKFASRVTVLSEYLKNMVNDFGYRGQVYIIPNAVDFDRFSKEVKTDDLKLLRESFGFDDLDKVLITTSRLVYKNAVSDVVDSLKYLPENIKFLICGDGELKENLKLQIKNLKLEDRVVFGGNISHADLPKYLKASDIFIRPSLSEGFGNSFIEAMACSIPVIATPVGGIVDFLIDGKTGYFCKPNDPKNIADTIKRVIDDEKKDLIVKEAYNMVKEKYCWDSIVSMISGVFRDINHVFIYKNK